MNRIELHQALDRLLDRLEAIESTARALVGEYNQMFPHARLCLYLVRDRDSGHVYGPYWGRLRKITKGGQKRNVKDYIGTRLVRRDMYRNGLVNLRRELRTFDQRARKLRKERNRSGGRLRRLRRILQGSRE